MTMAIHEKRKRILISSLSIFAALCILLLKYAAYSLTGSTALKSDALESVVNVVAACFAMASVLFADRPADANHPYGHGKIEYFSAAFEGGLITLAAILIFYEAIQALLHGVQIRDLSAGLLLNFGAGLLNGLLGLLLLRSGRKLHSRAIEADGHHVLTDFYTSIGLLLALLLVKWTGYDWLDPIIALVIGLMLAYTGIKLIKQSSSSLMDEEDPKLIEKLVDCMNACKGPNIIDVHALRSFRSGRHIHIDIHVAVPEYYPLYQAHDLVEQFANQVLQRCKIDGEFHAHLDPCRKLYCRNCAVPDCPIRLEHLEKERYFSVQNAVSKHPQISV